MPFDSTPRMTPRWSSMLKSGNMRTGGCEDADHAPRGRWALRTRPDVRPVPGIDHTDAEPVGIGMLLGGKDTRHAEGAKALVRSSTDLTPMPIMVSLSAIASSGGVGFQMLL